MRRTRLIYHASHMWLALFTAITTQYPLGMAKARVYIETTIPSFYHQHHVMPADPAGDALHLALASFHRCDFLLTWNCRHLANANKFPHIRRVNGIMGLFVPSLVTPLELIGDRESP